MKRRDTKRKTPVAGLGALQEIFGADFETRLESGAVSQQSCIVPGCTHKFWIPYGRYYQEGGDVNRGVCDQTCYAAYREILNVQALAAVEAFSGRMGLSPQTLQLVA
ncbi:MAG: hypothetical protein KBA91_02350 [Candidatus Moranbacteria bacterium]|jgi:hypothetical protein|nr:hypothetical protein [Candidatus Moranbacteria bacterium]